MLSNSKKTARVSALALIIFSTCFCGNSLPFQDEDTLKRPTGISVSALSPLQMNLSYFVSNQEETFIGYNVYISRSTIGESEARIGSGLPALNLDGNLPTFKHDKSEVNTSTAVTKSISLYNDSVSAFESGVTYFFRIAAMSRTQLESPPSNEVSATAVP